MFFDVNASKKSAHVYGLKHVWKSELQKIGLEMDRVR